MKIKFLKEISRDEYYDPDTENRVIAELIVTKHNKDFQDL